MRFIVRFLSVKVTRNASLVLWEIKKIAGAKKGMERQTIAIFMDILSKNIEENEAFFREKSLKNFTRP